MMTEQEQQITVCGKLKDLVGIHNRIIEGPTPFWLNEKKELLTFSAINWPTEGLRVCHEAERLIINEKLWYKYCDQIYYLFGHEHGPHTFMHATYQQRLEALCRVWWPERFI